MNNIEYFMCGILVGTFLVWLNVYLLHKIHFKNEEIQLNPIMNMVKKE